MFVMKNQDLTGHVTTQRVNVVVLTYYVVEFISELNGFERDSFTSNFLVIVFILMPLAHAHK